MVRWLLGRGNGRRLISETAQIMDLTIVRKDEDGKDTTGFILRFCLETRHLGVGRCVRWSSGFFACGAGSFADDASKITVRPIRSDVAGDVPQRLCRQTLILAGQWALMNEGVGGRELGVKGRQGSFGVGFGNRGGLDRPTSASRATTYVFATDRERLGLGYFVERGLNSVLEFVGRIYQVYDSMWMCGGSELSGRLRSLMDHDDTR